MVLLFWRKKKKQFNLASENLRLCHISKKVNKRKLLMVDKWALIYATFFHIEFISVTFKEKHEKHERAVIFKKMIRNFHQHGKSDKMELNF